MKDKRYVEQVLAKFSKEKADEELRHKVAEELAEAKAAGVFRAPFEVVLRRDPTGKSFDYVEVILETKR